MRIERIEYFWGLFDEPDSVDYSKAKIHVVFEASEIPDDVLQSFMEERIYELRGEFGILCVGKPEQVDCLEVSAEGETWQTRVFNRAITLFTQDDEEVRRLHRFFCVIGDTARKKAQ